METSRHSMSMFFAILMLILTLPLQVGAQQIVTQSTQSVPRLVNFSGRAVDVHGKPIPGVTGVTFAIYKDQSEGSPLWMETQNVQADAKGNYTAQLGATKSDGLPLELFSSGEGRWLGVRINGGEERPRVLLLSVPYALKSADAQTLGGLPPSAFVLAASPIVSSNAPPPASGPAPGAVPPPNAAITGVGTVNAIPLWDGVSDIVSSAMTQTGAGATARIGINTITPTSTLDVKGSSTFRGALALPAIAPATTAAGKTSQALNLIASSFNAGIGTPLNQTFRLLAEPLGNNTASTGGTLNLLYGSGANAATETGLKIASNGRISFAAGQTFPGAGSVASVGLSAPGSDFTVSGSPVTTSGTFGFNWKVAPATAATANAIVKRDSSGGFSAGVITAGRVSILTNSNLAAVSASNLGSTGVTGSSANSYGVVGLAAGNSAAGVYGDNEATHGIGVEGDGGQFGVVGLGDIAIRASGTSYGVYADSGVYGVFGSGSSYGVWGETSGLDAVHALAHASTSAALGALNDGGGDAIYAAVTNGGVAGFFLGDVQVAGNLSKSSGSFKIDHPLDPANKYLYHSFVESPDMMNIYNGNVTTDAAGNAVVRLPEWFESLNRDFRYQLTVIGQFAQAIVASEVAHRQFSIRTDKPNVKVSWQVTGIRQDAWANAHRIPVEESKPERERGSYLHPELYGAPKENSIGWLRHPESMKPRKRDQAKIPALKETGLPTQR